MNSDLTKKIESLPEVLRKEVEDFVDFLNQKAKESPGIVKIRKAGFAKNMFLIKDGFDDPLEDFKAYQ